MGWFSKKTPPPLGYSADDCASDYDYDASAAAIAKQIAMQRSAYAAAAAVATAPKARTVGPFRVIDGVEMLYDYRPSVQGYQPWSHAQQQQLANLRYHQQMAAQQQAMVMNTPLYGAGPQQLGSLGALGGALVAYGAGALMNNPVPSPFGPAPGALERVVKLRVTDQQHTTTHINVNRNAFDVWVPHFGFKPYSDAHRDLLRDCFRNHQDALDAASVALDLADTS